MPVSRPARHRVVAVVAALLAGLLVVPPPPTAAEAPAGSQSLLLAGGVGHGDGLPATQAPLDWPRGVEVGPHGDVYIADFFHHQVRVVRADGTIDRVAGTVEGFGGDGGPARNAQLNRPMGLDFDAQGNLYVADGGNHRIRRIDHSTGVISTVAGDGRRDYRGDDGPARRASLAFPYDVAAGPDGSIFIADYENLAVRRVAPDGTIETYAGNGTGGPAIDGVAATLSPVDAPTGVAVNPAGVLYVSDEGNCRVRRVSADGTISTAAGSSCGDSGDGGRAQQAQLGFVQDVEVDATGRVVVADPNNGRVRAIGPDGTITTVMGNGATGCPDDGAAAADTAISGVFGVAVAADGSVFATSQGIGACHRVYQRTSDGSIRAVAGNGTGAIPEGGPAAGRRAVIVTAADVGPDGLVYYADGSEIWRILADGTADYVAGAPKFGNADGPAGEARFSTRISGLDFGPDGTLWVADHMNRTIRRIRDGVVETVAGSGEEADGAEGRALEVGLSRIGDLAVGPDGTVYFTENRLDGLVRRLADGMVTTVAGTLLSNEELYGSSDALTYRGDGGPATLARLNRPRGIAVGPDRSLFVADTGNQRIRRIDPDGTITTAAGDGGGLETTRLDAQGRAVQRGNGTFASLASFPHPEDVAVDAAGNLFILDGPERGQAFIAGVDYPSAYAVRQVSPGGVVSRVTGTGIGAYAGDGPALDTPLYRPLAVAATPRGLLVADSMSLRLVTPPAAGWPAPGGVPLCDPFVDDEPGDATDHWSWVSGPNRDHMDVLTADAEIADGHLDARIDLAQYNALAMVPPTASRPGHANIWMYVLREGDGTYHYLAAVAPVNRRDPLGGVVTYEYGRAKRMLGTSTWTLERRGEAVAPDDGAPDTVTLRAALADVGLVPGEQVIYQEALSGGLIEYTDSYRVVFPDDIAPQAADWHRGTTRSFVVGERCEQRT